MKLHAHIGFVLSIPLMIAASFGWSAAPIPYQNCFDTASRLHDVPVDLLLAVAATESAWNPDARSDKNAHGIMQIQWPGTARHLGVRRVSELYNPCLNIELGARYLRELIDASDGNVERALASYNYGPTRISNSVELPAGAIRYVETVAGHQQRIGREARRDSGPSGTVAANQPAGGGVVFDSGVRARGFAEMLNKRINGAAFSTRPDGRGGHLVAMTVADTGLSSTDLATLNALGWTQLGAGR